MRIFFAVFVIVVAIIARGGDRRVSQIGNKCGFRCFGRFDNTDFPTFFLFGAAAAGNDFAADFNDKIRVAFVFQKPGDAVDAVAFGNGGKIDVNIVVALFYAGIAVGKFQLVKTGIFQHFFNFCFRRRFFGH